MFRSPDLSNLSIIDINLNRNIFVGCFFLLFHQSLWSIYAEKNTHFYYENPIHDFHICKSDINYDIKSNTLQLTIHVFIDDLQLALKKQGNTNLQIGNKNEKDEADQLIASYLISKLTLTCGSQKLKINYLGKEVSSDLQAIYCYLEVPYPLKGLDLYVKNQILTEIFDDQKNLVTISKNRKPVKQYIFDSNELEGKIKW